jgi:inhibitor of KinA sporulation pathway (predicted exonuclease)
MNVEKYLVIDLEATCSQDGTVPRDEMEIIEIGAVLVESEEFKIVDQLSFFVRPVRHPKLTDFCISLTTIKQEQVDNASLFPEALQSLCDRMWSKSGVLFCSWGKYDKNQFLQDCAYHKVAYPFGEEHLNVKTEFAAVQGRRPWGLRRALKYMNLKFEGTPHRGIDDALNITRLLPYSMKKD